VPESAHEKEGYGIIAVCGKLNRDPHTVCAGFLGWLQDGKGFGYIVPDAKR
jgi:hypothetical protein